MKGGEELARKDAPVTAKPCKARRESPGVLAPVFPHRMLRALAASGQAGITSLISKSFLVGRPRAEPA